MSSPATAPGFDQRADFNWARYEYLRSRGHRDYCDRAMVCENMYLGGGLQWRENDKAALSATKRKATEQNEIMQAVNSAIGYQISNRMDISFTPRGHGADDDTADTLSKVTRQISDRNGLHWIESDVFANGMIMQRGYFDIRMCFDEKITGEIDVSSLDPTDVIPDPDANEYDADTWADVTVTRWPTIDEIGRYYGQKAKTQVENFKPDQRDYTGWDGERLRARFGTDTISGDYYDAQMQDVDTRRYRVIDRQYCSWEMCDVMVWPTGKVTTISKDDEGQKVDEWRAAGAIKSRRMSKRIKWLVTTSGVTLFDDYSPYPFFTTVLYCPYFRRGRTRGMVDNLISPQETLNKSLSTGIHIFNASGKGGFQYEQGQITNMTDSEFAEKAGMPGLVIVRKPDTVPVTQIQPPPIPAAINMFVDQSVRAIKSLSGSSEELNAENSDGMSGVAIQARQFAAQQKLAIPLDNLLRTRTSLAKKILWMIQEYMSGPEILRITEKDIDGKKSTSELPINQEQKDGSVLNDLTIGDYDVVISETPLAVTFDNTQFMQLQDIAKILQAQGEEVPAQFLIRYSNVTDKAELIQALDEARQAKAGAPPQISPLDQAKADNLKAQTQKLSTSDAALIEAQVKKILAEAAQANVVAIYSATQAAAEVAALPQVAGIADEILGSAGFQDQNAAPIISTPSGPVQLPPAQGGGAGIADVAPAHPTAPLPSVHNTDPLTPPSPRIGADAGIEKQGVQQPVVA